MKKREHPRALGGADTRPDDYAMHETDILVRGVKDGKPFNARMPMSRFDEIIERCSQQYGKGD